MTLHPNMVQAFEECTTAKQVNDLLEIYEFWVAKRNAIGEGFEVWLDDKTRIYQPDENGTMKVEGSEWPYTESVIYREIRGERYEEHCLTLA